MSMKMWITTKNIQESNYLFPLDYNAHSQGTFSIDNVFSVENATYQVYGSLAISFLKFL